MKSNCWIVALAFRCTHENCTLHIGEKGPGGSASHAYVTLNGRKIGFRSIKRPLPWYKQLWFEGELKYGKAA